MTSSIPTSASNTQPSPLVTAFIARLKGVMGATNFHKARSANQAEVNGMVCHMHDYCDANQCALDVIEADRANGGPSETDIIDAAADLYDAARPHLR